MRTRTGKSRVAAFRLAGASHKSLIADDDRKAFWKQALAKLPAQAPKAPAASAATPPRTVAGTAGGMDDTYNVLPISDAQVQAFAAPGTKSPEQQDLQ